MPGEVIVNIASFLDPRSRNNFAESDAYIRGFMDDQMLWTTITLQDNWVFHNDTFLFMLQFADKIQNVIYEHTGSSDKYVRTLAKGTLCHMYNLKTLSVKSPFFQLCDFLKGTPQVEELRFMQCPMLDIDNFVDSLTRACLYNLRTLDLRGVPSVSSFHVWTISFHTPSLRHFFVSATMSCYFAWQVCEHYRHLSEFDCAPLCAREWHKLAIDYPRVKFGTNVCRFL